MSSWESFALAAAAAAGPSAAAGGCTFARECRDCRLSRLRAVMTAPRSVPRPAVTRARMQSTALTSRATSETIV